MKNKVGGGVTNDNTNDITDDINNDEDYEALPGECVTRSDIRDTSGVTARSSIRKNILDLRNCRNKSGL